MLAPIRLALGSVEQLLEEARRVEIDMGKVVDPERRHIATALHNSLLTRVESTGALNQAMATYIGMNLDIGRDAGRMTLQRLGLGSTFHWTHPREVGNALYRAPASKWIASVAGTHVDELSGIIANATNPARPLTINQVRDEISQKWGHLTQRQATVIARTETARAWTTTSTETMQRNGIAGRRVLIAHGPAIGVTTSPVCAYCVTAAGAGYLPWEQSFATGANPPFHPSCRCDVAADLRDWLPPTKPWNGQRITPRPPTRQQPLHLRPDMSVEDAMNTVEVTEAVDDLVARAARLEKAISDDIQAIAKPVDNTELGGFKFRSKVDAKRQNAAQMAESKERMRQKVAESIVDDGMTLDEAVSAYGDTIRYTFLQEGDNFAPAVMRIRQLLREKYTEVAWRNRFKKYVDAADDDIAGKTYKGINSNYQTQEGLRFEIQFHTKASFDLKNERGHKLYEIWRDIKRPLAERQAAEREMLSLWSDIDIPRGADDILDYVQSRAEVIRDKVRAAVGRGIRTHEDSVRVGRIVMDEMDLRAAGQSVELRRQLDELNKQFLKSTKQQVDLNDEMDNLIDRQLELNLKIRRGERQGVSQEQLNAWRVERDELAQSYSEAQQRRFPIDKEVNRVYRERVSIQNTIDTTSREKYLEVMRDIRPMAPKGSLRVDAPESMYGDTKEIARAIDDVIEMYPKSWVEQSNANSAVRAAIDLDPDNYGSYSPGTDVLRINVDKILSEKKTIDSTTVHEVFHRMEEQIYGIGELETSFYRYRTAGEAIQNTQYGPGKLDRWGEPYMAKSYEGRIDGFWEIGTRVMQSLQGDLFSDIIVKDRESVEFVLGLLAGL